MSKVKFYGFWGKLYVYGTVIYCQVSMILIAILSLIEVKIITPQHKNFLLLFLFITAFFALIEGWLHPWIILENDGLNISRLFFIRRKVKWSNMKLKKKIRGFTRPDVIGSDPRYALIIIKDGTIIDKYAIILPVFKEYDDFISEIESKLSKDDVFTDRKYR